MTTPSPTRSLPALVFGLLAVAAFALTGTSEGARAAEESKTKGPSRILTVGASSTEIVFALGLGDRVVATDTSSLFPAQAQKLPKVGYHRNLSSEGVLALKPDLIVATTEAGPPPVIAQLKSAGVKFVLLEAEASVTGAEAKIRKVASAVGRHKEGEALIAQMQGSLKATHARVKDRKKPRVLFVYARGNGALMVSGTETAAAGAIDLAHGQNAVAGYTGYKPLTAESMISAKPDVILIPERALKVIGGIKGLRKAPGVELTPAARNGRIVAIDDVLVLGFGPRLGDAVEGLVEIFHGK